MVNNKPGCYHMNYKTANKPVNNIFTFNSSCSQCQFTNDCLTKQLDMKEIRYFENVVLHPKPLQRGKYLFRQGEQFRFLYLVRSGCVRNYVYSRDGTEQIIGFTLPGELLGLDSMENGKYVSSAVALETTSICKLPFERFEELCRQLPNLQDRFFQLSSKKIVSFHNLSYLIGHRPAEERLASFLVDYSLRIGRHGYSKTEFNLSMTRYDIANFLGLTIETVSRLFTKFSNKGVLKVERRLISIIDPELLMKIAKIPSSCAFISSRGVRQVDNKVRYDNLHNKFILRKSPELAGMYKN